MELLVSNPGFIKEIPKNPGVYRFYAAKDDTNIEEELLYVGKALNLQYRVKSYFQKSSSLSPRISLMVTKIARIEITVTENEVSALILENNLIKSLKPKYNIIFRDDKTYPLIRLSKHEFPKMENYRGKPNLYDRFFGPFPNSYALRQSLDMIGRLFRLRTCTDASFAMRDRPCMLYQIKRCDAPCVSYISQADYAKQVDLAVDFMQGNYSQIMHDLTLQMNELASAMEFEKASVVRDKIGLIKQLSRSQIINNYDEPLSADLVFCEGLANKVFIYLIILRNGIYIGDKHFILANPDASAGEVFEVFLEGYYLANPATTNVFTTFNLSDEFKKLLVSACGVKISHNITEQVKKLYNMGMVNLHKIIEQSQGDNVLFDAAVKLAKLLDLDKVERIECIDISHNQGENTVASLVVYENGKIDNNKYRRYNLDTDLDGNLINGDDLLAMETVIKRRFLSQELKLPDVILLDGGQLQYDAVKMILNSLGLYGKIRLVAIFKGERRDPVFDQVVLPDGLILRYQDEKLLFKLLQGLRDEAHRFAITGHRKKQVKKMVVSKLNDIPNIGTKKKQALIASFGSVKDVANASIDELCKVNGIGLILANQIYAYFH